MFLQVDAIERDFMPRLAQLVSPYGRQRAFWVCIAATVLAKVTTIFFNGPLNAVQSTVDDATRDWATLVQAVEMIVLALVARRTPHLVASRPLTLAAGACAVAGAVLAPLGVAHQNAAVLLAGSCLTASSIAWASVLWLVLCSSLEFRPLLVCFAAGGLAAIPLAWALAQGGYVFVVACYAVCVIGLLALCSWHTRRRFADYAHAEAAADAEITRPRSVLPLTHDLFVYIFVFSLAYGFGLRYQNADGGLLGSWFMGAVLLAVLAYALGSRPAPRVDVLFSLAFALLLGGFLLVLLDDAVLASGASTALACSNTVFGLLMTVALCTIAARSLSNALPSIAWGYAAYYVGIGLGAQTGIFVTGVAGTHSLLSRAVVALILGAVMLYTLFSIRDFGFDKTIASVERDAPVPGVVEVQYEDRIAARCQQLATSHGLTERETDVFGLLAHGNNTLRIQEELSITKNTLKYHTRHIYEKLGVHSQQELIDLL